MHLTKQKPHTTLDLTDTPQHRWTLIYFAKDGRSMRDDITFDTMEACEAEGKQIMDAARTTRLNSHLVINDEVFCYGRDLSHYIPMPVGDA